MREMRRGARVLGKRKPSGRAVVTACELEGADARLADEGETQMFVAVDVTNAKRLRRFAPARRKG